MINLPAAFIAPIESPLEKLKVTLPESVDNSAVIRLMDEWAADKSGYDERVWPIVKELIEDNRLSDRKRFSE